MTLKEAYKKIRESGDETYIEPYEFTWDPDMEDFPLFAKSVLEACKEVIEDHDAILAPDKEKDIFHLMMQEYVLPEDVFYGLNTGDKLVEYIHTVQYYETDKMGITHHSNYIRWMEEARVDFYLR